jgi:hypothetical protein
MPFKVKNLMVDVPSATTAAANLKATLTVQTVTIHPTATIFCHIGCTQPTFITCHFACSFISPCTFHTLVTCQFHSLPTTTITHTTCGFSVEPTTIIGQVPQSTPVVKEQLQQALAAVEAQQAAAEESLKPQSLEDVEMLEKHLTEALAELKTQKADLQKKGPSK